MKGGNVRQISTFPCFSSLVDTTLIKRTNASVCRASKCQPEQRLDNKEKTKKNE